MNVLGHTSFLFSLCSFAVGSIALESGLRVCRPGELQFVLSVFWVQLRCDLSASCSYFMLLRFLTVTDSYTSETSDKRIFFICK